MLTKKNIIFHLCESLEQIKLVYNFRKQMSCSLRPRVAKAIDCNVT